MWWKGNTYPKTSPKLNSYLQDLGYQLTSPASFMSVPNLPSSHIILTSFYHFPALKQISESSFPGSMRRGQAPICLHKWTDTMPFQAASLCHFSVSFILLLYHNLGQEDRICKNIMQILQASLSFYIDWNQIQLSESEFKSCSSVLV